MTPLTAEEISRIARTRTDIEAYYRNQTDPDTYARALHRCRQWPTCRHATGLQYAYQLEFLIQQERKTCSA